MRFLVWTELMHKFMESQRSQKLRITFDIFDYDKDGVISMKDILAYINNLKPNDRYLNKDALRISKIIESKFDPKSILKYPQLQKSQNYLSAKRKGIYVPPVHRLRNKSLYNIK